MRHFHVRACWIVEVFYLAHCLPFTATTTTSATTTTPTTATGKVGLGDDASGHTARNAEEDESGSGIRNRGGTANDGTDRGRVRAAMRRGEKIQKTTQRESKSAFWFLDGTINEWSGTVTCSTHSNRRHSTATYSEYFLTFFFGFQYLSLPPRYPSIPPQTSRSVPIFTCPLVGRFETLLLPFILGVGV